ncbi:MAG TPA: hypothetical protein VFL29_09615 [Candidatus Dormibacteraeota bacterium]|nr:hypothetical protein [Candidatus Dormibacteraeota bacterium]
MVRASLVLLLLVTACGIDAPWDGPTLPAGARTVAYQVRAQSGLPVRSAQGIVAATSIAELRSELLKTIHYPDPCVGYTPDQDPCWERIADQPGQLYVAIPSVVVCYRTVKETAGLAGRTLYFIYWIGKVQKTCNLALAQPLWRLISFARADLPASGTLTVDLQTQEDGSYSDVATTVELG